MKPWRVYAPSAPPPLYVQALGDQVQWVGPFEPQHLAAHANELRDVVAVAGMGDAKVPATLMDALPALKLVSIMGVGYDGVDVPAALARGVQVSHTPDVLNDDVADLAFALMLAVTRRVVEADRMVRAGQWGQRATPTGVRLTGQRLGVLGMGRIGQAIARRAAAFDMPVTYTARSAKPALPYAYAANAVALAQAVDVLVVITPGGADTHHLVNHEVLQALGPQGVLINVARGSVVDEAALLKALQQGVIAGAGLDVYENEPYPLAGLYTLDNVVLTPHVGSATPSTRHAMADLAARNMVSFLSGHGLLTPVPECAGAPT
jgi:hydroxypyruvate reductase